MTPPPGPALGGVRIRAFLDVEEALSEVLGLARAMTYKAAVSCVSGDPSYFTALGTVHSIAAAARHQGADGLVGLSVAVQGVGHVGTHGVEGIGATVRELLRTAKRSGRDSLEVALALGEARIAAASDSGPRFFRR
jgi:glutamate dehydrogenase/leucine dehydrogenase